MGSVGKVVKQAVVDPIVAPVKAAGKLLKGDVSGALDQGLRGVTAGTVGMDGGSLVNVNDVTGVTAAKEAAAAQAAQAKSLIEEQKNAENASKAKATAARRAVHANDSKTVYTTALGDVANSAGAARKKRTLLGG